MLANLKKHFYELLNGDATHSVEDYKVLYSDLGLVDNPAVFCSDQYDIVNDKWYENNNVYFRDVTQCAKWCLFSDILSLAPEEMKNKAFSELAFRTMRDKRALYFCVSDDKNLTKIRDVSEILSVVRVANAYNVRFLEKTNLHLDDLLRRYVIAIERKGFRNISSRKVLEHGVLREDEKKCIGDFLSSSFFLTFDCGDFGLPFSFAESSEVRHNAMLCVALFFSIFRDIQYYIFVPASGVNNCDTGVEDSSGGSFFWVDAYSQIKVNSFRMLCAYYAESIRGLYRSVIDWNRKQIRIINSHATKSAIGSIMSRNGSHNIGSHVLAALTHNVGTMPDDRVLYQYIQHRMDYIATVTTDPPTWTQPTMLLGELVKGFLAQRHLLEHIAESEGLSAYEFQGVNKSSAKKDDGTGRIEIHVRKLVGNEKYLELIGYSETNGIGLGEVNLCEDVALAIPGGAVGHHAFYTIIENVIRNAAKHDWAVTENKVGQNLRLYIDFEDSSADDDVKIEVWTKLKALEKDGGALSGDDVRKWLQDLDNEDEDCLNRFSNLALPQRQQILIERRFIDSNGGLRRENWGLAEMKISAGYLNRCDFSEIGGLKIEEYDITKKYIILPFAKKDGGAHYLGYRFRIPKPRELLLVVNDYDIGDGCGKISHTVINAAKKRGVYITTIKDIESNGKKTARAYEQNYRYVVLPCVSRDMFIGDIKFPFRVLSGKPIEGDRQLEKVVPYFKEYDMLVMRFKKVYGDDVVVINDLLLGVYKCWCQHLKVQRNGGDGREIGLLVRPFGGDVAGGRSLISNRDVLNYVLRECLSTCVDQYKKYFGIDIPAEDEGFYDVLKNAAEYVGGINPLGEVYNVSESIARFLRDLLSMAGKDEYNTRIEQLYATCLTKKNVKTLRSKDERNKDRRAKIDIARRDEEVGKIKKLLHKGSIGGFIEYVETVYEQVKVLFKQYEENIVTLPRGYKPNIDIKEKVVKSGNLPIKVEFGRHESCADYEWIAYKRHENKKNGNELFVEPLSGTQSYLTQIIDMVNDLGNENPRMESIGLCSRLFENGMMRVLVVDERVSKFVKEHAEEVYDTYENMSISVMDDKFLTTKKIEDQGVCKFIQGRHMAITQGVVDSLKAHCENKEKTISNCSDSHESENGDYEILIIHQGILDKWFPDFKNNQEKMREILEGFKKFFPYVVITTGRGTPVNIPRDAHLIPFAVVEAALFRKYPEKMILVDAIMNVLAVGKADDQKGVSK